MKPRFIMALAVILVLVTLSITYAGDLSGSRGGTNADGTAFTARFSLGCISGSLGGLGPNKCHSQQPYYCPTDSEGGNDYEEWSAECGCPTHWDEDDEGESCEQCEDPCLGACESYESCNSIGDWCENNYECTCDIDTEAEGCSQFTSCGSGEECEFSGGDLCDPGNYECVDTEPACECNQNYVCWYEGDGCDYVSYSIGCSKGVGDTCTYDRSCPSSGADCAISDVRPCGGCS